MPSQASRIDPVLLLQTLTAMKRGDFSVRLPGEWDGLDGKIADTFNEIVATTERMALEMAEVRRVVGTQGKLSRRIEVPGLQGMWALKVDSINALVEDLAQPIRDTGRVIGQVARGVLTDTLDLEIDGRPLQGEFLKNARTINTMVGQLNAFASEVTRVAREVGTDGKLGGQAQVPGVSGIWKDLTDNVNHLAGNLTNQVRNIAAVTTAVANGDLSRKITVDARGEILELKSTVNSMVDQLNAFASEVSRVAHEVGIQGRLGGQARVPGAAGVWQDLTENVNLMAGNLTDQVRNIATVTTAVANGDLSRKITVDALGEILELKSTVNSMVDQLNGFASEVTRVAREVGTEGRLGGQAQVTGVSGVWKDLTENVNIMADNLTDQVRGIAKVVSAVAAGNLKQKMIVPAKGEIAELADTINAMVETLATFSDQVTRVAREVGVEGRLGGQATVPGAAGAWKDLVDNVNELAANLSTQVRAIGEVATAVTEGDLTRSITVVARGEVAQLKDNVNQMIRNLRDTTARNDDQNWLKTNLARLTRVLQGERDMLTVARALLSQLAPLVSAQHAVFYRMHHEPSPRLRLAASYGYTERHNLSSEWRLGEGLVGQAAYEKQRIVIANVPPDYVRITSGLGEAVPLNLVVLPILFEGEVKAVIELASLERFQPIHLSFLDQLADGLGIVLSSIEAAANTEALLKKSQALAGELKSQQDELQHTNSELEGQARRLAEQNTEVERKNREIEEARLTLQDKAEQLALTSKYKSEFLANMSHELRTPLNSLLLLAEQLSRNPDGNFTSQQLEMINVIYAAGSDLLRLINDILDLSKIEAGSVSIELEDMQFDGLADDIERTFRHLTDAKGLELTLDFSRELPASMRTDGQRLRQILRNLLSNAIKFTERGRVHVSVHPASGGWTSGHPGLETGGGAIAFAVSDSGIGIPKDKQKLIFEAFQQAEAGTSRRYGGTGLGLAISREIAALLGGELRVESEEGVGSTFTLYLPLQLAGQPAPREPRHVQPDSLAPARPAVADDRGRLRPGEPAILIVEDDQPFARLLMEAAHQHGFKALVADTAAQALALARRYLPRAITLDLTLADGDGWQVLERLKQQPATRGIPVHVISVRDRPPLTAMRGAASYQTKPVDLAALTGTFERIEADVPMLVLEPDPVRREQVRREVERAGLAVETVADLGAACEQLDRRPYRGVVLGRPVDTALAALRELRGRPQTASIPVIYYAPEAPAPRDRLDFARLHALVLVEGEQPLEQMRENVMGFLSGVVAGTVATMGVAQPAAGEPSPPESAARAWQPVPTAAEPEPDLRAKPQAVPEPSSPAELPAEQAAEQAAEPPPADSQPAGAGSDIELEGRKVLVVDDDARNLFALTGVLEAQGVRVIAAESGADALAALRESPDIELVLMDIMMPGMDGYEAIRRIRADERFHALPIIAVTAKAMAGDRERCLEAGASDYIAKPVATEPLLERLRANLGP